VVEHLLSKHKNKFKPQYCLKIYKCINKMKFQFILYEGHILYLIA
jgi:hypothetical protein